MSDFNKKSEAGEIDDVGRLIGLAGAREQVPQERMQRSHDKVLEHWESLVSAPQQHQSPSRFNFLTIAAALLITTGVALITLNLRIGSAPLAPASVEQISGVVEVAGEISTEKSAVASGSLVTTRDGRISLRMARGQSLRVDEFSTVLIEAQDRITLQSGGVYIDSDYADERESILINTPYGSAQDIGTRFQVRVQDQLMVVGVRDGQVEVASFNGDALSLDGGHYVTLTSDETEPPRALDEHGPDWNWVEDVVPGFSINDASLAEYLAWYTHEKGLELRWSSEQSQLNAQEARLSGSIEGLTLDEGLEVVRQVAPFTHERSDLAFTVEVE